MRAAIELTAGSELSNLPAEYLVLMVRAQTEITIEYINTHPEEAAVCRELGFQILLKGLAGN